MSSSSGDRTSAVKKSAVDLQSVRDLDMLAQMLTDLRLRAGLSVRDVGKRCGLPTSTLGGYFSGRHLPPATRPEVLRDLLESLGVPASEHEAWHAVVRRLSSRRDGGRLHAASPYPGLAPFRASHAGDFHGREALVRALRDQVGSGRPGDSRVVIVTGASGSGKSSLIHAGLIPLLNAWTVATCVPGRSPYEEFGTAIRTLTGQRGPVCLVVDQLEELWTAGNPPELVTQPLEQLIEWSREPTQSARVVVLSLRADYYGEVCEVPDLLPALRDHQIVVGPMSAQELEASITRPALDLGITVEPGLVAVLVRECQSMSQTGPASPLPHLSHCLAAMWRQSTTEGLTLQTYFDVGGIAGAIGQTAEEAFAALEPADQERVRHLLLRLVSIEEGFRPSASTQDLSSLTVADRRLVNDFAEQRLLTVDTSKVRLGHEALIESWPRLRAWIEESRAVLLQRRSIAREAALWEASNRDDDLLLRGARLDAVRGWPAEERSALEAHARAFVDASAARADQVARARRRSQRRLQLLSAATSAISVIALVASTGYVITNRNLARERDEAQSRQVAVVARTVEATNSPVGRQLAVAAYGLAPTVEARSALLDATAEPAVTRIVGPVGQRVVAISQTRHLMAVAGMLSTVVLYDISGAPKRLGQAPAPVGTASDSTIFAAAFSPDGSRLALGGDGARVRVLDVSDPAAPTPSTADLDTPGTVYAVAFAADGTLYAATQKGGVRRWVLGPDGATPEPPLTLNGSVQALALGPDGQVAAGTDGGVAALWRTPSTTSGGTPNVALSVSPSPISSMAFTGDGALLVGSHDGTVKRFTSSAAGLQLASTLGTFTSWVNAIVVHEGLVVAGSSDGTIRLWRDGTEEAEHSFPAPVASVGFADTNRVLLGTTGGEVDLVDLSTDLTKRGSSGVFAVGFDHNGQRVVLSAGSMQEAQLFAALPAAVASTTAPQLLAAGPAVTLATTTDPLNGPAVIAPDGNSMYFALRSGRIVGVDTSDPGHPTPTFDVKAADAMPEQLAIDATGRRLIVAGDDKEVHVLNLAGGSAQLVDVLRGPTNYIIGAAISPDGNLVAAASLDNSVRLWQHQTNGWAPVASLTLRGAALTVAFDPSGTRLAAAGTDHTVHIWDISTPTNPRSVATLTGPGNDVYQVAFSATGDIAAASMDKTVTVWHPQVTASGPGRSPHYDTYAVLRAAGVPLYSVAWSADGSRLLAGGADGVTRLWTVDPGAAQAQVCASVGAPVTREEWAAVLSTPPFTAPCPG